MDKQELQTYKKELAERFWGLNFNNKYQLFQFIVDKETGVEYLVNGGITSSSSFTPLLDAEGKPKINQLWKEGKL
ncbi:DUF6440 family protein [Streptococcus dentiloxodontae]